MNPDADHDQADIMAALLNAMYEAPAYKPPVPAPVVPEPAPDVQTWHAEPAPAVIPPKVDNGPDWERLIPRLAIGIGAALVITEVAIVATNWRLFLHILEGVGIAIVALVLLAVLRRGGESVTVTGRGLKVWR